jgi:GNAT superfamily N-acetyltransferase
MGLIVEFSTRLARTRGHPGVLTAPRIQEEASARLERTRGAEALLEVPAAYGGWGAFLGERAHCEVRRFLLHCREDLALHGAGSDPEEEVADLLRSLPREGLGERRILVGLFGADGELLALLDAARAGHDEGGWRLAGVLVRPDVRGRGIGAGLVEALEEWVRGLGGRAIHLAVQRRNRQALHFARRSGFSPSLAPPGEAFLEHLARDLG